MISIHALLAESDALKLHLAPIAAGFLSTLSLRRATEAEGGDSDTGDISIHALLAESDSALHDILKLLTISIHALLAESDPWKAGPTAE